MENAGNFNDTGDRDGESVVNMALNERLLIKLWNYDTSWSTMKNFFFLIELVIDKLELLTQSVNENDASKIKIWCE